MGFLIDERYSSVIKDLYTVYLMLGSSHDKICHLADFDLLQDLLACT